jgi:phosphonate transport system substrate-binding protein
MIRIAIWLCLFAAIGLAANSLLQVHSEKASNEQNARDTVASTGWIPPTAKHLAAQFADAQGKLLADPPSDPKQIADPETICVAHVQSSDADNPNIDWDQLESHLAQATSKKITDMVFDNSPEQLAQIGKGAITIVALHAADAPFLVNNYGFEPIAVLGDESGANGNHLDILVPANSSITHATDLKGHVLTCTVPSSITGYRAAVALLMQNEQLRPNVDYTLTWSLSQTQSITDVADGKLEAAAVSDDKLQTLLKKGKVSSAEMHVIYQSEVIPRTTIGYFNNLKPELAEQVKAAVLSYHDAAASAPTKATAKSDEDSDTSDSAEASGSAYRFIPIDYKKDFQLVRLIDDSFDPRLNAKKLAQQSAAN